MEPKGALAEFNEFLLLLRRIARPRRPCRASACSPRPKTCLQERTEALRQRSGGGRRRSTQASRQAEVDAALAVGLHARIDAVHLEARLTRHLFKVGSRIVHHVEGAAYGYVPWRVHLVAL